MRRSARDTATACTARHRDGPRRPSRTGAHYTRPVDTINCGQCGGTALDPGFVEDSGDHSRGYARWIPGALETGFFGNAKRMGKQRWKIVAYRCSKCGHLELFTTDPV